AVDAGVTVFAADCNTPQTTFELGQTVCVTVTGFAGLRLQWVDADGFGVSNTDITTDPQNILITLPNTDQSNIGGFFIANNLGNWRASAVTTRNSSKGSSLFTVKNPNNPKADVSIVKSFNDIDIPDSGSTMHYRVDVINNGPDDAVNVHFVDNTFTNATFNSLFQRGGPTFTCQGADCQIAQLRNGAVSTFILNFTAGAPSSVIDNTATVSTDTPELNTNDNSSSAASITVTTSTTPPPPPCNIAVT